MSFFNLRLVLVRQSSMAPTYQDGMLIVAQCYRPGDPLPERGDVVTFYPDPAEQTLYIKRVIGLPGDELYADNDSLWINGSFVDYMPGTGSWIVDVPDDCVFCLGDNRAVSYDSRMLGPIPIEQIYKKILSFPSS